MQHVVRLDIEVLFDGTDFSETLTRARFEEINNDMFKKTLRPAKQVLEDIGLSQSQVDEIVLVGEQLLRDSLNGKEPSRQINPDEVAVDGGVVLLDVTLLSLRMETVGGIQTPIILGDTVIPAKKSQIFSTHQDEQAAVTAIEFSRVSAQ